MVETEGTTVAEKSALAWVKYKRQAATACVMAAAGMFVFSVSPATATDAPHLHRKHHGFFDRAGRLSHGKEAILGFSVDGLPTRIPGAGTYVGAIGAVRGRGNGNYFAVEGGLVATGVVIDRSAPKIIHVTPETVAAACRPEKGICVIRP